MILNFIIILLIFTTGFNTQTLNGNRNRPNLNRNQLGSCLSGSCSPENGNLLIGRKNYLYASSTCGQKQPERYCVIGATFNATQCYVCDSRFNDPRDSNMFSHVVENIVSVDPAKSKESWWQSENGLQDVYIQFDLEAEFLFTHMIMTFKSIRPAAMVVEKSSDFASTWQPIAYFAQNCKDSFSGVAIKQSKLGDVYCEQKYSSETPTSGGQVIFRMLPPQLTQDKNPNSPEIQDLLKITNIRLNFTKMHTFGDTLLDARDELKEKYYYALYELVVRGSCLCYGHANKCIRTPGVEYDKDVNARGMIHGYCQCTHYTDGNNCERCLPLYNDRPWAPALNNNKNECKKCECNNHAQSCHFDEDLFIKSGNVSGGVCDYCQHNTEGRNCELCKENHFRDPQRNIDDPFTCRPCQCLVKGTTNGGKCDSHSDENEGLVAGKCHCKDNVDGIHCDRCKNGFFNLTADNPQGCESCLCNLIGTTGNLGCDKVTGSCSCKLFVAGRACDQCAPGFFGLSQEDPNGCKACDCYPGGSVGSTCDAFTGQCTCKPNMTGRRCDIPIDGHYCPLLTHLLIEAEEAQKLNPERSKDTIRQIYGDRKPTWTGSGFVRLYDGAGLEFNVNNIQTSAQYEIVIRYEQHSDIVSTFNVKLLRNDPYTDPNGPCANIKEEDDMLTASLSSNFIHQIVKPSVCLEAGKNYKVQIELLSLQSSSNRDNSVLIDSIVVIPVIESLPEFKSGENRRIVEDYLYYRCKDTQLSLYDYEVHDVCKKYICAIGVSVFNALPCKCNPTGSQSSECDQLGGSCKCKVNVVGKKCDQCAPSTWGFGPNGCQLCNCHSVASKDNYCDVNTGACSCYDHIIGQKCDSCQQGYWYFPQCMPCTCNGFADSCNQTTGYCVGCKDNTDGDYCDRCKEGFYGEPVSGQSCKECMCPGGHNKNQFSKTCYYDGRQDTVICQCEEGYEGYNCERCSVNYYGNPLVEGGKCKKCECNGNIDVNDRSSCDQETGKCNNCLFNTGGDHCEVCAPGFYGNASNHDCKPCYCYPDGTENHSTGNCDAVTGQCLCLKNVIGRQCDKCEVDHYGIASGNGCTSCECEDDGTRNRSTSCNENGQCDCLQSRGGLKCSECSYGYWGDPTQNNCQKCECNPNGSKDMQCDKLTGQCFCKKGITGYHCDRCDRGTYGDIPECRQCGECFDNWSAKLASIKTELDKLENQAINIAVSSAASVDGFSEKYLELETKLNDVQKFFGVNSTDRQLKLLHEQLNHIEKQISNKKDSKDKFYNVEHWSDPASQLNEVKTEYFERKKQADLIKDEANAFIESTNHGAKLSIQNSLEKSKNSTILLEKLEAQNESELKLFAQQLKDIIEIAKNNLDKYNEEKKEILQNTLSTITESFNSVSQLNLVICGAEITEFNTCDSKCGGSGCNSCGSNNSSCSGLADAYRSLMNVKKKFDDLYNKSETSLKQILMKWRNASLLISTSNKEAISLEESALKTLNILNGKREDLKKLTENIKNFNKNFTNIVNEINDDINYINDLEYKGNDGDLDKILNEISILAGTVNLNSVQFEAQSSSTEANKLQHDVESVSVHYAGINQDLEKLTSKLEKKSIIIKDNEEKISKLENESANTKESIEKSKSNLDKVTAVISSIQKSVEDLKKNVDFDKEKNFHHKQEQIKSKIKESNVTLDRTKILLKELDDKLVDITNKLQNSDTNNMDVNTLLIHLTNLKKNINQKENEVADRNKRLKDLEESYNQSRLKYDRLKLHVDSLKSKTQKLKEDINDKLSFFSACN